MEQPKPTKKLNIVMFPWLAFGHLIPYLELANQLAKKGHHIFFVSTPRNLQRLPKIPQNTSHLITLVPISLPKTPNLPLNAEATTDVGSGHGTDLLKEAYDGLKEPMRKFLEASSSSSQPLDWIIYDFSCYWLPQIVDRFGIRKVFFSIWFARTLSILGPLSELLKGGEGSWIELCTPPRRIPFEDKSVYFLPFEARILFEGLRMATSTVSDVVRYQGSIDGCDVIAIRSCMELESQYFPFLQKYENKVVLPVGLLPPSLENYPMDDTWQPIICWLNKQRKGSVVYIALGSEFEPSQDQLNELALGLELSKLPFFWAFRRSKLSPLVLPEGFEDRTRDRGMIWTSWVPQLKILSNDSVGGFLTHCGWSSIIEALQFGKPLVMLPLAIDHGLYARFMVHKKVGVEIPRNVEDGSFTGSCVVESLRLVFQDEVGQIYRDEAQKLSAIFGDKSLHGKYIDQFNDYLCDKQPSRSQ
uniref:Glycosyltransferase n=1 Tax=Amaranthus tricolor TaxID=29722 RepID=A0A0D5CNB7_AMATR|nr:UDP-rhamnose:rhamnosyltransferase 1-like protein [Amaranthus tricolor]